jgi:hypothetical protein
VDTTSFWKNDFNNLATILRPCFIGDGPVPDTGSAMFHLMQSFKNKKAGDNIASP